MIIATACSSPWYPRLECLVASLHANNYEQIEKILIYNLGLSTRELEYVIRMEKVELRSVPYVNPYVLTTYRSREQGDPDVKYVGLMTWKPAILKQVIEQYQTALWLDAGATAWGDLTPLWQHTQEEGYFFLGCDNIDWCSTDRVKQELKLTQQELDSFGINAGIFGFSRKIADSFINPAYELARDISLFVDNGTASGGPTAARHEQTILSILAVRAGLKRDHGPDHLCAGKSVRITCNKDELDDRTIVYHSRGDSRYGTEHIKCRPVRTVPVPWGSAQVLI